MAHDVVVRMREERDQLVDRIAKLESFIGTAKYNALGDFIRSTLTFQLEAMRQYRYFLCLRLHHMEQEHGQEKAAESPQSRL